MNKNKILVSEIISGFLQYVYLVIENPYFKVGYMISPEFSSFKTDVSKSFQEAFEEENYIKNMPYQQGEEVNSDMNQVLDEVKKAIEESGIEVECKKDSKKSSFKCYHQKKMVIHGRETSYTVENQSREFVVINFLKSQKRSTEAEKLLFQMKIPVENKNNLHLRVKEYTSQYLKSQFGAEAKR